MVQHAPSCVPPRACDLPQPQPMWRVPSPPPHPPLQHLRGDINLSWPTGQIAVMGSKGAVEILFRCRRGGRAEVQGGCG